MFETIRVRTADRKDTKGPTHQAAADGGVDLPEDVTDHVQGGDEAELQGVVDHHVDEHDVPRVLIEQSGATDKHELRATV